MKHSVDAEEALARIIGKYINNPSAFRLLFPGEKSYVLQNKTELFYNKHFSYSNISHSNVFEFVNFYQKYDNSLIINVRYRDSCASDAVKQRYKKFVEYVSNLISPMKLLKVECKDFGTQYVYFINFNDCSYSIIYNNHNNDLNDIKIIVILLK
ncbi:hypothetical protein [Candidatus Xenohaliotis californiensis]